MFKKGFIFPGLQDSGYESGFSLPLTPELRTYPDLNLEVIWFQNGKRQGIAKVEVPEEPALFVRSWESKWGFTRKEKSSTDLYCLRITSPSHPDMVLPPAEVEGQMMLRHLKQGWTSSVLTNFVPLRPPGHRYAPIIHMAHCMASAAEVETIHLFMNIKNIDDPNVTSAGTLVADVQSYDGAQLGKANYPIVANATVAISHDTIAKDCGVSDDTLRQGIHVKFYGGESQFAILTLFRHRLNGSIAIEHTLPPPYYIPALRNPVVRNLVYGQLEMSQ